jgi:uncharacterized membrane protein
MRSKKPQVKNTRRASASQIILAVFSLIIVLSVVLSLFINS